MPGIVKILFERKDWCVIVSRVGPLGLISLKLGLPFSKINISSLNSLRKIGQNIHTTLVLLEILF